MYADENDGRLVGCSVDECLPNGRPGLQWVQPPQDENGVWLDMNGRTDETIDKYRFNGIRAGDLWKYYESLDVLHCPADDRWSKNIPPRDVYRSYGMPYCMGWGWMAYSSSSTYKPYLKIGDIRNPSRKYVFVEEDHLGMRGFNNGGWHLPINETTNSFNIPASGGWDPGTFAFYDPVGIWHNNRSTFAFADGHVEIHSWEDKRTQELVEMYDSGTLPGIINWPSPGNKDVEWLLNGFVDKSRIK